MTKAEQLELREEWRKRVAAFEATGLSGAAWCASQGLKPHLLQYWRQQFTARKESATSSSQWLTVDVKDRQHPETASEILIRVGDFYVVEVRPGFDQALLANVIQVLAAQC